MKRTLLSISACLVLLAACKKDDETPGTFYLTRLIEVGTGDNGNDTTFVSYNADNTLKELYSSATENGVVDFYGEGPVYEGGKIAGLQQRSSLDPTVRKVKSFVYTGSNVTRVNYWSTSNDQTQLASYYDSLVYTNGKLSEYYSLNSYEPGYETKFVLAWEGNNVKTCSTYMKQNGGDFTLFDATKYTYDNKTGFQTLLAGNYYWLSDLHSFDYLSANNLVKEEVYREGVLRSTTTNVYTYDGNLLKMVDTEDVYESGSKDTYKVKLEYATR